MMAMNALKVVANSAVERRSEELIFLDGALTLYPKFAGHRFAESLFSELLATVPWTQPTVRLFGREIVSPRLAAWFGDDGAAYRYSGVRYDPIPWSTTLATVKKSVEQACGEGFNSALLNLYRDGRDSMGWHSDNEPELAPAAAIASLSLGARRRFRLHDRKHRYRRIEIPLVCGSLLVMRPPLQSEWRHCVPREAGIGEARINLTFRNVR